MKLFLRLFSRRWLFATFLVIIALGVLIRLGFWQLDRLAQRRASNAHVMVQTNADPLILSGEVMQMDLASMEYRKVVVTGEYDFSHEIALINQAWNYLYGVHLLTPLKIAGTNQAILIDRGWIPADDFTKGNTARYAEPGVMEIHGVIRVSQAKPSYGRISDPTPAPGEFRKAWNLSTVEKIAMQMPYPLLSVYIQQSPAPKTPYITDTITLSTPIRMLPPELEEPLDEGSHASYAIQWFSFAAVLGMGYPFFVRREENKRDYNQY